MEALAFSFIEFTFSNSTNIALLLRSFSYYSFFVHFNGYYKTYIDHFRQHIIATHCELVRRLFSKDVRGRTFENVKWDVVPKKYTFTSASLSTF